MKRNLVKLAKYGDKKAFVKLTEDYKKPLYSIAKSILHDDDDVKESLRDTIVHLYNNMDKIKDSSQFGEEITKTLIQKCNEMSSEKDSIDCLCDNNNDFESMDFLSIIDFLDNREKAFLVLSYEDNYSIESISNIFNIEESDVQNQIDNIKNKIETRYG